MHPSPPSSMATNPTLTGGTHRPYRPTDRAACLAVFASNVPRFFHEGERQDFADFLDGEADRYLVVLDGDDIVGCGGFALGSDEQEARLCWGMLRRDRHRQGLGAQLLRARLEAIAATKAVGVRLSTSQHTAGFYRRHGFVVQSVQVDGLAPGLDAVEMRLDLAMPPCISPEQIGLVCTVAQTVPVGEDLPPEGVTSLQDACAVHGPPECRRPQCFPGNGSTGKHGITLVLLPGLDGSGDFFDALCRELPAHWRTQVVRYPGNQMLGYRELADLVLNALPAEEPFFLLAESFSGPVAIQVAAARPRGLRGLVLCATFARNPRPMLRHLDVFIRSAPLRLMPVGLLAFWLLGADATTAWTERIRRAINTCSVDVLRWRAREVLSVDVLPQLKAVHVPLMYLQATHDHIVPASALIDIQRELPANQVAHVDGPHFLLQTRPRPSAQRIAAFVETIPSVDQAKARCSKIDGTTVHV